MNYDFSGWHKACANKTVTQGPDGLHITCLDCGVSANMEAVSAKISSADACLVGSVERKVIGGQSAGVNKGVAE